MYTHWGQIKNFKDGAIAFGIGAGAGLAASFIEPAALAPLAANATIGAAIGYGIVSGAIGAAVSSPLQGIGNAAYFGDVYTGKKFMQDVIGGAVVGGIIGGVSKIPGVAKAVSRVDDYLDNMAARFSRWARGTPGVTNNSSSQSTSVGGDIPTQQCLDCVASEGPMGSTRFRSPQDVIDASIKTGAYGRGSDNKFLYELKGQGTLDDISNSILKANPNYTVNNNGIYYLGKGVTMSSHISTKTVEGFRTLDFGIHGIYHKIRILP